MKEIMKWLTEKPIGHLLVDDYLDFTLGVNETTLRKLLQNGWWHVLPFASQSNGVLALYMIPNKNWQLWPVVKIYDFRRAVNFAPNISYTAVCSVFESIYLDSELRKMIVQEWPNLEEAYKLLPSFMNNTELLSKTQITMRELNELAEPISNDEYYQMFWTSVYPNDEILKMHTQINKLTKDSEYLPTQALLNDPSVVIRYHHLQGARAYSTFYESDSQTTLPLIWSSLTAPAGYNAENIVMRHRPNEAYDSDIQDFELANLFVTAMTEEEMTQYVESPWYKVFQAISRLGNKTYRGEEHLYLAKQLIENKETESAWIALVSAAYWSGMNGGKVKWEAKTIAKEIVDCEGHTEISEVLSIFKTFYS